MSLRISLRELGSKDGGVVPVEILVCKSHGSWIGLLRQVMQNKMLFIKLEQAILRENSIKENW